MMGGEESRSYAVSEYRAPLEFHAESLEPEGTAGQLPKPSHPSLLLAFASPLQFHAKGRMPVAWVTLNISVHVTVKCGYSPENAIPGLQASRLSLMQTESAHLNSQKTFLAYAQICTGVVKPVQTCVYTLTLV